jgi:biotin synthase
MAFRALVKPTGLIAPLSPRILRFARPFGTVVDPPYQPTSDPPPAPSQSVFQNAVQAESPRNTWTKEEIAAVYNMPLIDLTYAAVRIHSTALLSASTEPASFFDSLPSTDVSTILPQSKCVRL